MLETASRSPFELTDPQQERLAARLGLAVRGARRSGSGTLATISVPLPADADPSAVVCASRRAGEEWFVFEQPDRGRAALAGLGQVIGLRAGGSERFKTVAERWRSLSAAAVADSPEDPGGGAPVAVGGFAFSPDGGSSPHWAGFEPASLTVPEVLIRRAEVDGELTVRLTLAALASPDDTPEELFARLSSRLGELSDRGLPLLDPAPAGRFQLASTMPPEHYEAAVVRAVEMIGGRGAREGGARARSAGSCAERV